MYEGYAVIDVETTGLKQGWHHRVVEVAIVHVDRVGVVTDEWCTLVNPKRDLGPQHKHGITAAEVRRAPDFGQVAAAVVERLRGRVLVAHNLVFDAMHLAAEFDRLDVVTPLRQVGGVCTMRWANSFLAGGTGRSLQSCCQGAGVRLDRAHSALHDARAAAGLLTHYLAAAGSPEPWSELFSESGTYWPTLPPSTSAPVRRSAAWVPNSHFLSRIADRLPRVPEPPQADAYLAVLDDALRDRELSVAEQGVLVELATELGLDRAHLAELHRTYLEGTAHVAWEDGYVSDEERADLLTLANLLGVDQATAGRILADPGNHTRSPSRLAVGDIVAFTGQMREGRAVWEQRARAAGLVVNNVTKSTKLLVAADPDSLSRKADRAQKYCIPIITETGFARLLVNLEKEVA